MSAPLLAGLLTLTALVIVGCGESKRGCASTFTTSDGEVIAGEQFANLCEWEEGLSPEAVQGARVFLTSGCTACHTYRGVGARSVGGSDLSDVGRRHTRRFFERYVRDPSAFGNEVMPKFALRPRQLRQLALFLVASRGAA